MSNMAGQANGGGSSPCHEFLRACQRVTSAPLQSEDERIQVLLAARELIGKVETPWDVYVRLLLNQPATISTLKVFADLGIVKKWDEQGNIPMTSSELAGLVGKCDPALLHRMLRLLASNHFIEQVPVDKFKPGKFLIELSTSFVSLLEYHFFASHHVYGEMPKVLAEMGYQNPVDNKDTIFQRAKGYKGDLWSYCREYPQWGNVFNTLQEVSTGKQQSWMDMYPHHTLIESADPSLPLFVDVGGGIGHDLMRFYNVYPEAASRIFLADLPEVVASNMLPESVKKVDYDFFTPQPVKHAKAYYLHHIIHDWSDEPARKILEMQKSAMKPGYSKLLIHDQILDDDKSQMSAAAFDMTMMVFLAGQERTKKQWLALLDSVGLKAVKFWTKPPDEFSVIEVEIPQ